MNKPTNRHARRAGARHYELTNHLGNVLAVIADRIDRSTNRTELLQSQAYEPFGRTLSGSAYFKDAANKYRFGFNGQETETEINANILTAEYWEYDTRLGRRWNPDPVNDPSLSEYACFNNNPMYFIDPNGLEPKSHRINLGLFTISTRLFTGGLNFQWNFSFSEAFMHVVGGMRNIFTGAHHSLHLIPMGSFSNWNFETFKGTGTSDFDFNPKNSATYRYRSSYIRGFSENPAVSFTIRDRQKQGLAGFIDKFTCFEMFSVGNNGLPNGFELFGASGLIPFLNSYFLGKATKDFHSNNLPELVKDVRNVLANSLFTMPHHNRATHFRVSTASSVEYEFTIRYRAWKKYGFENNKRPFTHRFLYGTRN